jgi:hypothetical protein
MCGVGVAADRRPIDPPPIVELHTVHRRDNNQTVPESGWNLGDGSQPCYFMFASLVRADRDEDLMWLKVYYSGLPRILDADTCFRMAKHVRPLAL